MTVEQATQARTNVKLQRQIVAWQAGALAEQAPFVPGAQAKLSVKLSAVSGVVKGQNFIHISCLPDADTPRPPVTLIPIIDISGSMSENCLEGMQALIGIEYTRLKMVQYSLGLIIKILDANDYMAIVTFSSGSQVVMERTQMTPEGKARANAIVQSLRPGGCTDIWGGLQRGMAIAEQLAGQQTNPVVMLFTDGQPTSSPPGGEVAALTQRLNAPHRFTISTFGYGGDVPSDRMMQMAQVGNGVYGYCPLPGMVMSIFLNFVAQAATCITQRAEFELRCAGGRTVKEVRNLYQGQALNFLLPGRREEFGGFVTIDGQRYDFPACRDAETATESEGLSSQFFRQALIKVLKDGISNPGAAPDAISQLWGDLKEHRPQTPFIRKVAMDLLDEDNPEGEDLEAQPQLGKIYKAFVPAKFAKWGKDEIRALITFHEAEVCGVLLDASLQEYQSGPFAVRRRFGWREFCGMPRIKGESKIFSAIPDNNPSIIKSQDGKSVELDQQMIAGLAGSFIQG